MSAEEPFPACLARAWPPQAWQDVTLVLAVSGGPDSVAMLRAMAALKTGGAGRLVAVHVNHALRAEAAADERFVGRLCERLAVPCRVLHVEPDRIVPCGDGLEASARTVRYDLLQKEAERLGARYVVAAHTADDQAETILHRIVRGTGIAGLSGMLRARPLGPAVSLIRPLLTFRRAELIGYLHAIDQPYCHDASNDDRRFTRNRIRHELLPELAAKYNPGVVQALLRLGSLAGEVQGVVDALIEELVERGAVEWAGGGVRFSVGRLAGEPRYLVRELIISAWRRRGWPMQAMGHQQWDRLVQMLEEKGDRTHLPGNVRAEVRDGWLVLADRSR